MKTLKEITEILYSRGYKESKYPYEFLNGRLTNVSFRDKTEEYLVKLGVYETPEFEKILDGLPIGTSYECDYKNYEVTSAYIQSPVCSESGFMDGSTNGINLVAEPDEYCTHSLDLFEQCLDLQTTDLIEHELRIVSKHKQLLTWVNAFLKPILKEYNFCASYSSLFDCQLDSEKGGSSDLILVFRHPNQSEITLETDCITGDPTITFDIVGGFTDLIDQIYNKKSDKVASVVTDLLKKYPDQFGYLFNNDPHETIDSYHEVMCLIDAIRYNHRSKDINFDIIPARYNHLIEKYKSLYNA